MGIPRTRTSSETKRKNVEKVSAAINATNLLEPFSKGGQGNVARIEQHDILWLELDSGSV